jgi:hypothetical protein
MRFGVCDIIRMKGVKIVTKSAKQKATRRVKSFGTNPLDYSGTMSLYEKESLVAEAKLAEMRKQAKRAKMN